MLLKSIYLKNFRNFKDENTIEFSTNNIRNVSIILGENGSGKTTLAEAFTWCLYGLTDFEDPSMLNKVVESKLEIDQSKDVTVKIQLIHDNIPYSINRSQTYKKTTNNNVRISNTSFRVSKKVGGQQEFIENPELVIKGILPKELSNYFFLNGEHINKLNKELKKGKSDEFRKAVENLLGLKAFLEAIDHLSPTKRHSVIGSYNSQYDFNSNTEISKLRDEIQNLQDEINSINSRIPKIDEEIETGEEECKKLERIIGENEKSAEYQDERIRLEAKNKEIGSIRENEITILLKNFNTLGLPFISKKLITDSVNLLDTEKIKDKGIPEIHQKTIDYLIKRKSCICGTEIIKGNKAYKNLIETLDYIPPKSIAPSINSFLNRNEEMIKNSSVFFDSFETQFARIRSYELEIENNISKIEDLNKLLEGMKDVGVIQSKLSIDRERIQSLEDEKLELLKKLGANEDSSNRLKKRLTEFALKDEANRRISIYQSYAKEVYDRLYITYQNEETKVRRLLENSINEIFTKIYQGGMSISIDDKYRIKVLVDEILGNTSEIETSTAQSTSVIFAFIAGIIKLAKDFSCNSQDDEVLIAASEPYPLVMDAPLSNFDKRRIESVCETLPKIAEQVIIFSKDTDGDIAEQHMGEIIGERYFIEKISEIEANIVKR